jgi:hypothetical protein
MLEKEFKYYLENQQELVKKYNGKYLVIRDNDVIGAYDKESDALFKSEEKYPLGTFLIQKCTPGDEAYTQTFHSKVLFAKI